MLLIFLPLAGLLAGLAPTAIAQTQTVYLRPPLPLATEEVRAALRPWCGTDVETDGDQIVCPAMRTYPGGSPVCRITMPQIKLTGRFTRPGGTEIIVDYSTDCEPHVNNFGGLLLFSVENHQTKVVNAFPGHRATDCQVLQRDPALSDALICLSSYSGMGYILRSLDLEWFDGAEIRSISIADASDPSLLYEEGLVFACPEPGKAAEDALVTLETVTQEARTPVLAVAAKVVGKAVLAEACKTPQPHPVFGDPGFTILSPNRLTAQILRYDLRRVPGFRLDR